MISQFIELGIYNNFKRVAATDALVLSDDDCKYYRPGRWKCTRWELSRYGIAVFESHRKIWKHVVEARLPYAIILEDDVNLSCSFPIFMNNINSLISCLDVVKLDGIKSYRRFGSPIAIDGTQLQIRHIIEQPLFSAGAYLVTQRGAQFLLSHSVIYSDNLDYFIFKPKKGYQLFQIFPALAIQGVLMKNPICGNGLFVPLSGVPELGGHGEVESKGPISYRLWREFRRGLRRVKRYVLTDWLLKYRAKGYIGRIPLEVDLGEYI